VRGRVMIHHSALISASILAQRSDLPHAQQHRRPMLPPSAPQVLTLATVLPDCWLELAREGKGRAGERRVQGQVETCGACLHMKLRIGEAPEGWDALLSIKEITTSI
jgi:hypothetical protein